MFLINIKPLIILFNGCFLLASLIWDSSRLHVSLVHSILSLSGTPFHGYTTVCLASNLWVDISVVSVSDYYSKAATNIHVQVLKWIHEKLLTLERCWVVEGTLDLKSDEETGFRPTAMHIWIRRNRRAFLGTVGITIVTSPGCYRNHKWYDKQWQRGPLFTSDLINIIHSEWFLKWFIFFLSLGEMTNMGRFWGEHCRSQTVSHKLERELFRAQRKSNPVFEVL